MSITLDYSTKNPKIDRILQGTIGIFEQVFPDRIRGYYLRGSYGNGSNIPNSDLDLYAIFKEDFRDATEIKNAVNLCESCALMSPILLEIAPGGEVHLSRLECAGLALNFKLRTQFLYGEDIRNNITMPPSDAWVRWSVHAPLSSLKAAYLNSEFLVFPLDYPEPESEFYGYDRQTIPYTDGIERPSTKLLIALVCWMATALIALRAGDYIGSKKEAVDLYKTYIDDEWTELIEQVYYQCRNQWYYLIPDEEEDRKILRSLCQKTLAFSNHFLTIYRNFLLKELQSEQIENKILAMKYMKRIIYPNDEEIIDVLKELQRLHRDETLKNLAFKAEQNINRHI
ncbi:MAG: hypothetical protein MUD14_04645 [Hydrococcus sp. Prado102]|jgi:hypothetical protein|nr:hypothetical protein [Hydrococcus sp. Prado102]